MAAAKHAIDREYFSFQLSGNPAQSEKQDLLCISKTTAVSFWKKLFLQRNLTQTSPLNSCPVHSALVSCGVSWKSVFKGYEYRAEPDKQQDLHKETTM